MHHVDWTAVGTFVLAVVTTVMCVLQWRDSKASGARTERLVRALERQAATAEVDSLNKADGTW